VLDSSQPIRPAIARATRPPITSDWVASVMADFCSLARMATRSTAALDSSACKARSSSRLFLPISGPAWALPAAGSFIAARVGSAMSRRQSAMAARMCWMRAFWAAWVVLVSKASSALSNAAALSW
jgi:hypothetical protein